MPEYTVGCVVAVATVLLLDLVIVRTRLVTTAQFWLAYAICAAFQVPVDGWLTKLNAPIVNYNPDQMLGVRFPWHIPVEDYLFGFAMILLTLITWTSLTRRRGTHGARTEAARGH